MSGRALPDDPASCAFRRFRRTGSPAAVTEVFDLVGGELYTLAAHLSRGAGEAEDLVQETFLVALARARRFDERRAVTPWLVGVLVKEAARQRRRRARRVDVADLAPPAAEAPLPAMLAGEVRTAVERALASLPPLYRDVLQPVLEDGVPPGALAARLGRAPGTVRAQLHRGLELLRRALPHTLAPAVFGAFALQLGAGRGLAAVRADIARHAALEGPAVALAGASVVISPALPWIGVVVMSTKAAVLSLTAVALVVAALLVSERGGAAPAELTPAVAPLAAASATEGPATVVGLGGPERAAARTSLEPAGPASPAPAGEVAPEAAPARRVMLRGTLQGTVPDLGGELTLLVRAGVPARVVREVPVSGDGPFVVDLAEALPSFDPDELTHRVSVLLVGAGYAESAGWARLVDEGRAGEHTLVVDVVANPIALTLRGRVKVEGGGAVNRTNLVEFVARGANRSSPNDVHPATRVDGDGRFELALTEAGAGTLVLAAQGAGVLHVAIAGDQRGDVDLGELVIPRGAVIAGRASGHAGALPKGSYVLARAPFAPAAWNERALGLQARDGKVHFEEVRATVGAGGEFELGGLEPGFTYEVVLVPAKVEGLRASVLVADLRGTEVTAPASGVALEESLAAVHVTVQSGGAPVGQAVLREVVPEGNPRAATPEALHRTEVQTGARNEAVVFVNAGAVTTVRVSAPSHAPVELVLDPAALPVERGVLLGPVVVELGAAEAMATLEWRVRYDGPGTLASSSLALRIVHGQGAMAFLGPTPLVEGAARFGEVPVGDLHVTPILIAPPTVGLADLPLALESFDARMVSTRAGEVTAVESAPSLGGRIELSLLGRSPSLPTPSVLLLERTGNEVVPMLLTADGAGHRVASGLDSDGPFLVQHVLPPGDYTLRIEGEGYRRFEAQVTVRAGESTRVTATLELAP